MTPTAYFRCVECNHRVLMNLPLPESIPVLCDCTWSTDMDGDSSLEHTEHVRIWSPVSLGAGSSGEPPR